MEHTDLYPIVAGVLNLVASLVGLAAALARPSHPGPQGRSASRHRRG